MNKTVNERRISMKWDADYYKNQFGFVADYGTSLLDWINPTKLETPSLIDLGCGDGRLSAKLQRLGYKVIGIDSSNQQIKKAKDEHPLIHFKQEDMTLFSVKQPVDVIFSNAAFHWLTKQENKKMLHHVFDALKPDGQLVFEMGGYGNNKHIHLALENAFKKRNLTYHHGFYFPNIGEYSSLIDDVGLQTTKIELFPRPTPLNGANGLSNWIHFFVQRPFTQLNISKEIKEEIIDEVVEVLRPKLYQDDEWFADYVRLRGHAIKPN